MQKRHLNRHLYFKEQGITTKKYVIPYINQVKRISKNTRVLEIGCGEGGNLKPFADLDCQVVGIDIDKQQIRNAQLFLKEQLGTAKIKLINQDMYRVRPSNIGTFDIIIMRDVIEHIPNQQKFLSHLKLFMKPQGVIFFGFPPWLMPFGGHQQICRNKILSNLPYLHLLPKAIYRYCLQYFNESPSLIHSLLDIKKTGIGIDRFQSIIRVSNLKCLKKDLFLINPNYEVKFGLKPRNQFKIISNIPILRDFLSSCQYCIVGLRLNA